MKFVWPNERYAFNPDAVDAVAWTEDDSETECVDVYLRGGRIIRIYPEKDGSAGCLQADLVDDLEREWRQRNDD